MCFQIKHLLLLWQQKLDLITSEHHILSVYYSSSLGSTLASAAAKLIKIHELFQG